MYLLNISDDRHNSEMEAWIDRREKNGMEIRPEFEKGDRVLKLTASNMTNKSRRIDREFLHRKLTGGENKSTFVRKRVAILK